MDLPKLDRFSEPMYEVKLYDEETGMRAFVVINRRVPLDGRGAGGLRMDPHVTLGEVRRLAETMTYKHAILNIAEGGAKAGIVADPTSPHKRDVLKAFARLIGPLIREQAYGMGIDMGLTYADLAFVYDEIGKDPFTLAKERLAKRGLDFDIPEGITYETIGSKKFGEFITGYGIGQSLFETCAFMKLPLSGLKAAIQGFGSVGSSVAHYLREKDVKVIAIADVEGTIHRSEGLDIEKLFEAKDALGRIDRSKLDFEYEHLGKDGWFSVGADVLIPAAIPDVINHSNVDRVDAKLIVEGANIPIAVELEEQLQKRGVMVVPDFVANGGAAAGYLLFWAGAVPLGSDKIFPVVGKRIREATIRTLELSKEKEISMRNAAKAIAVDNYLKLVVS